MNHSSLKKFHLLCGGWRALNVSVWRPGPIDSRSGFMRLDVLGSVLSTLCAIHCLAMPLVADLLPVLGLGFLGDRAFDQAACLAMMALAAVCLVQGCRIHRRWWLLALLGTGATLTVGTQFVFPPESCAKSCCADAVNWSQALVMFTGGGAIAAAHLLNLRFRRACRCCAESGTSLATPLRPTGPFPLSLETSEAHTQQSV
ncbi:MAG: MerC domain-containing protein [Verrucomicrobia bacterium]|nr:MerC domain-containing protein [Verrucomicrobiota bacterium]